MIGAVLLSWWAARSAPFSSSAELVTALALASMASVAVARARRPSVVAIPNSAVDAASSQRWWPWLALGVALVAWELICFALAPRADHPTISSLYDAAATVHALRGLCFFGWLCLGAALLRR